jgi:galactonate dehydratase
MKIAKIETIWFDSVPDAEWYRQNPRSRQALPNNLWVRIYTDNGLVGLGETYYQPRAVSAIIHDTFTPLLIGRDALNIENHWSNLFAFVNYFGFAGAEMRAISAIDTALWDLAGQYLGQPIYNLLGGRSRERIKVYNTCVGYGQYTDYAAWTEGRAGELAEDLLRQGITAMKIWPFDQFGTTLAGPAEPRGGVPRLCRVKSAGIPAHYLENEDLQKGLGILKDIRKQVGKRMSIAIEGHSRWDMPTSIRIARALEPYDILWLEDIMPPDNPEAYRRLKASAHVPLCHSERVFTRFGIREAVETVVDIVMIDLSWCGGFSEARKVASLADTYYLPVTTHDTIGPVALWAAAHLMMHIPNAMIMESVRGYVSGWYNDVVTDQITIENGTLTLGNKPGLGTALQADLILRPNVRVETTTERELQDR